MKLNYTHGPRPSLRRINKASLSAGARERRSREMADEIEEMMLNGKNKKEKRNCRKKGKERRRKRKKEKRKRKKKIIQRVKEEKKGKGKTGNRKKGMRKQI